MSRQRLLTAMATLVALTLGVLATIVVGSAGARSLVTPVPPTTIAEATGPRPATGTPSATLDQPGVPAIHPGAPAADAAQPSFTADDARAYVAAHPHSNQAPGAAPATAASVEFLPARVVDERLGANTGVSPNTLLCVVTLRGSFIVTGPPGLQGKGDWSSGTGYQIFDARTGNLIEEIVSR